MMPVLQSWPVQGLAPSVTKQILRARAGKAHDPEAALPGRHPMASMREPIKTLLFSTLYPSSTRPIHGIFVETRLRELLKSGAVQTQVVAPVPWFPSQNPRFGAYATMARTPAFEERNGLRVHHPRYFLPPKIGQNIAPYVLAAGALPTLRRLISEGFDFDLIDAHFYYPDGVAAALLARKLGKPFVCTARGSDINLYRHFPTPLRLIQRTVKEAAANLGVSADLVKQLVDLGANPATALVARNGVDLDRFAPLDRQTARRELGLAHAGLLLLCVGNQVELKGHALVIQMLQAFPDAQLVLVGSGPLRADLEALALRLGLKERVIFAGQQPNDKLKTFYSAADVLVLASSREGWPNVLLEAMACGTPVVATKVNGTPEIVTAPESGRLAAARDVPSLEAALQQLLAAYPSRVAVRQYAERFSWADTTRLQCELFARLSGKPLPTGN
jgi:glycosyltransferase involved in cell wall biosynthesis